MKPADMHASFLNTVRATLADNGINLAALNADVEQADRIASVAASLPFKGEQLPFKTGDSDERTTK